MEDFTTLSSPNGKNIGTGSKQTTFSSTNVARRSASIFSRRGTKSPEPSITPLPETVLYVTKKQQATTERKRSNCTKRRSASCALDSPPARKGTILNAVPPAKTIRMTPLEEEMATSPNEEIINAITGSPSTPSISRTFSFTAIPASMKEPTNRLWSRPTSVSKRSNSEHQKHSTHRIGTWANGATHWDEELPGHRQAPRRLSAVSTTNTTLTTSPSKGHRTTAQTKPRLSIVVPPSNLRGIHSPFSTRSSTPPIELQRPAVTCPPATIVRDFAVWAPTISPTESNDAAIRPGATPSFRAPTPCAWPSVDDISSPEPHGLASSASESSESYEDASTSGNSSRSSATSIETIGLDCISDEQKARGLALHGQEVDSTLCAIPRVQSRAAKRYAKYIRSLHDSQGRNGSGPLIPITATPDLAGEAYASTLPHSRCPTEASDTNRVESVIDESDCIDVKDEGEMTGLNTDFESVDRMDSVHSVTEHLAQAPIFPKRSRKRDWQLSRTTGSTDPLTRCNSERSGRPESQLRTTMLDHESRSSLQRRHSAIVTRNPFDSTEHCTIPARKVPFLIDHVADKHLSPSADSLTTKRGHEYDPALARICAEEVLVHILDSLGSLDDLLHTAAVSKGMYQVYKKHEMYLVERVIRSRSAAGWELRQWSCSRPSVQPSMPTKEGARSIARAYQRDLMTIEALNKLVLQRCHSVIRAETAEALSNPSHPDAQRFTDAFWRIWCFCRIFGCGKGREDDITGQLDWLKGGLLANNQDLTATMNTNLEYDVGSVLLNPPDYFAVGNAGGLSALQLYDMLEMWSCLTALLHEYHEHPSQAREAGLYDGCAVGAGDHEAEENLLEEWTAYLLTLGPKVVLRMATLSSDSIPAGFELAKSNGWTQRRLSKCSSSLLSFLKEPATRLYEDRIANAAKRLHHPLEGTGKEQSCKRVANLAAEINLARRSSTYERQVSIDTTAQPLWSGLSSSPQCGSNASATPMRKTSSSNDPRYRTSPPTSEVVSTPTPVHRAPHFSVPRPLAPPTSLWRLPRIAPIIEEREEGCNMLSLQSCSVEIAKDTMMAAISCVADLNLDAC